MLEKHADFVFCNENLLLFHIHLTSNDENYIYKCPDRFQFRNKFRKHFVDVNTLFASLSHSI